MEASFPDCGNNFVSLEQKTILQKNKMNKIKGMRRGGRGGGDAGKRALARICQPRNPK